MTEVLQVKPPPITAKSAVGSGDCLLAGIVHGLIHAFSFEESVKWGVAAGTANALTLGAGVFASEDFERILGQVTVTRLQG
jgi:fructose-1-phosphate kinase PfkB-like protein